MDQFNNIIGAIDWELIARSSTRIAMIMALLWVALRTSRSLLKRLGKRLLERDQDKGELAGEAAKRTDTLVKLLSQLTAIIIWVVAVLLILDQLGIDIAPLLASAGIAGLAIGFGAQNLVRDVITGFFMLLEDQVRVGDVAVINGTGGLVEKINFRTILLRDLSGTVHVFPNGTINTLANVTRDWSAYVFDVGVAYKEDTDRVVEIMRQVGKELKTDSAVGEFMLDDVEIFGVDNFADNAVVIKGRIRTRPIKQWDVGREFRRRLKKAFDSENIEIPFPQRTVYLKEFDEALFSSGVTRKS